MFLRRVLLLCLLAFSIGPAVSQEIDTDLVAPVPPPRPTEFGGGAPGSGANAGNESDGIVSTVPMVSVPTCGPTFPT